LAAYQFVALFSTILPHFNFTAIEKKPRTMIDAFTLTMDSPFMVTVQALEG